MTKIQFIANTFEHFLIDAMLFFVPLSIPMLHSSTATFLTVWLGISLTTSILWTKFIGE